MLDCVVTAIFLLGSILPADASGRIEIAQFPVTPGDVVIVEPDVRLYVEGRSDLVPVSAGIAYGGDPSQLLAAYADRDELRTGVDDRLEVVTSQTHLNVLYAADLPFGGASAPRVSGHDIQHTGRATFLAFPPASVVRVYAVKTKGSPLRVRAGSVVRVTTCPRGYGSDPKGASLQRQSPG